jgi:hypothetical protein
MATGKKLLVRVFLEGIEIPVQRVSVQFGVNRPASADIELVPTSAVQDILPRTITHIFYYDDQETDPDMQYKLLFAGEVIGYAYAKTDSSRSATLSCIDFTTYWDTVKRFYYDDLSFNYQKLKSAAMSDASRMSYDFLFGPAASLASLLKQNCRSFPELEGILSGIIRVLESIGGYHEGQHTKGINDFFTMAQLRLNLYQMLGAPPHDDSALWLLDRREFYQWLRSMVAQGGNMFTLRQTLETVLQAVFYQHISNPAAMYYQTDNVKITKKHASQAAPEGVIKRVNFVLQLIQRIRNKSMTVNSIKAPNANDFAVTSPQARLLDRAKKHVDAFNAEMAFRRAQAKRNKEAKKEAAEKAAQLKEEKLFDAVVAQYTDPFAPGTPNFLDEEPKVVEQQSGSNSTVTDGHTARTDSKDLDQAYEIYVKFMSLYSKDKRWTTTSVVPREKLLNTIFLPDIFMCAPPMCNVIFPEQYTSFQHSRSYLNEITRVMVTTPQSFLGMSDPISFGNLNHYAPDMLDVTGKPMKEVMKHNKRFMLPHEVFTGPIPQITMFSDIRQYDPVLGFAGSSILKKIERENDKLMTKERGVTDNIPYLQHVANMMLAQGRYANRSAEIPMTFSPQIVAGVPCVIIDKYQPSVLDTVTPQHWLGVPVVVAHVISQNSASTRISVGYIHRHDADDDMFYRTVRRKVKRPSISYQGTFEDLKKPRNGGKIVVIGYEDNDNSRTQAIMYEDEAQRYIKANLKAAKAIKDTPADLDSYKPKKYTELKQIESEIGTDVHYALDEGAINDTSKSEPRQYLICEELPPGTKTSKVATDQAIPFEDQIRPPWLSKIFQNQQISDEVYQELYGVDAITMTTKEQDGVRAGTMYAGKEEDIGDGLTAVHAIAETDSALDSFIQTNSIRHAVDYISSQYSYLRSLGSTEDTVSWIQRYTKRPIATMREVLGAEDLTFDDKGLPTDETKMGFHSKAFGSRSSSGQMPKFDPLLSMDPIPDDVTLISRLPLQVDALDPRPERRECVMAYILSLSEESKLVG